jgi:hypothetical protein
LPPSALKCIESWRKYFPDQEIREWTEGSFDVNRLRYTKQAYQAKKFAFVSDYARLWILYHHGGIYFDTDVEVVKPFDDILSEGAFMGCEIDSPEAYAVNPGLGIAVAAGHPIYKEVLDTYSNLSFVLDDGRLNMLGIVRLTTGVLLKHGLQRTSDVQQVSGITIYPPEYFNPLDDATGRLFVTSKTHSIHWYSKTWVDNSSRFRVQVARLLHRLFDKKFAKKMKRMLHVR